MAFLDYLNAPFKIIGDHLNASWNALGGYGYRTDEEIKRDQDKAILQKNNELFNFNQGFEDLFKEGASSEDLFGYLLHNGSGIDYDREIMNNLINQRISEEARNRNDYQLNINKMKEAGINPLVGLGSVGSLGSGNYGYSSDLSESVAKANTVKDNGPLSDIKNLLQVLLMIGKL